MLSLHINNIYAKKKGIAKKLILTLRAISTIDEAFPDSALPTPRGPPPLWEPGSIPDNWADVCGFLIPPGSDRFWKVRMQDAFSIPRKTFGFRPTDQSCHHETWLHLDIVDWSNAWSKQGDHDRHIFLKERPAACSYGNRKRRISEVMSDRNHLHVPVSCDLSLTSSRSDLMSLAVFDKHATGEACFDFILSFSMLHFPSRTPCPPCQNKKREEKTKDEREMREKIKDEREERR